jgi:hypothetical protein
MALRQQASTLDEALERLYHDCDDISVKEGAFIMSSQAFQSQESPSSDESAVVALYRQLLDGWNRRSADAFAASFTPDGVSIGFDGSQMSGQAEIAAELQQIFANHLTAPYVSKVRDVRFLSP